MRRITLTSCLIFIFWFNVKSIPPDGYILMFEDNFDGSILNTNYWSYRVEDKYDARNLPANVRISNGKLNIDFKKENLSSSIVYTCGGIISKKCFGYGYYEVSSKTFGETAGLHTSFWTLGVSGNGTSAPKINNVIEIDGYEIESHAPDVVKPNLVYYIGNRTNEGPIYSKLTDTSMQYVTHGFEWTPTYIKYYTNGVLIRTIETPKFYASQNIWLTALGTSQFSGTNIIDSTKLPGTSQWDYIRYYAKDINDFNLLGNSDFEYNIGPDFNSSYIRDLQYPISWCESGDINASYIVYDSLTTYSGLSYLQQKYSESYSVITTQHLDYIPNGVYTLKARVRSSGGQLVAQLIATDMGSNECFVNINNSVSWTPVVLENIVVKNNSCTVGIKSIANANQWLDVDAVEFIQEKKMISGGSNPLGNDLVEISTGNNFIEIKSNNEQQVMINIYDYIGRLVYSNDSSFAKIILSKGTYIVRITSNERKLVKKISIS